MKLRKFRVDIEDMPEEIEAYNINEAVKIAHESITIIDLEDMSL